MREFNEKKHHPDRPDTSSPHRTTSTSFPRKQESCPLPQRLKKILRHSREGGNPTPSSVIPAKAGIQPHHPSFPRRRESTIPAHAGIQRKETPSRPTRHLIPTQNYLNVIPAKTGILPTTPTPEKNTPPFPRRRESNPIIRHSREGGNPTPSSVIPAKAGIHNSRACGNSTKRNAIQTDQTPHPHTELPQRHSRENRNPAHYPNA